jgi:glycosyltransferase involved in cell wall biosynthesis
MKILLVNGRGYPKYGGENYFTSLCRLLELKGNQVVVFTSKDQRNIDQKYNTYCVDKINLDDLGSVSFKKKVFSTPKVIYSLESRANMERLIRDIRPDLVHLHQIKRFISPSILAPIKKAGIPIVQTLQDYQLVCPNYRLFVKENTCEACKDKRYYHAFFRRCVRNSFALSLLACFEQYCHDYLGIFQKNVDVFISPTKFLKDKMIELGFNAKKILHVPNFIFAGDYQPNHEFGEYIVYSGRLVKEKGADIVIRAMRDFPSVKLLVLGDGEYRKSLEAFAAENNINNVEFRGYLSREEIKPVIAKAIFTIVASRWYEVCPLVILESFAMGKPVIGADIGGIPELIDNGINGLLFKPDNAAELSLKIKLLLNDREMVKLMGQKARQKAVESYGADLHYDQLRAIYQSLL